MKDELMLHARDKKVQHMTKDGLVEKNLATGEGERVSKRDAETSFDTKEGKRLEYLKMPFSSWKSLCEDR